MLIELSVVCASGLFAAVSPQATSTDGLERLPPLRIDGVPIVTGVGRLRSPLLEGRWQAEAMRAAQRRSNGGGHPSAAPTDPASAGSASEAASAESSEAPADDSAAQEDDVDLEQLRRRERMTRIHRAFGISTVASLAMTELAGTILFINRPTAFGPGNCASGNCVFGEFGQSGLATFHAISAAITTVAYTTTGIFALTMPDPEHASVGSDARANRLRWHRRMAWIHLAGMILEPLLGIVTAYPGVVGVPPAAVTDFQRNMYVVHMGVGYVTLAALATGMTIELLQ